MFSSTGKRNINFEKENKTTSYPSYRENISQYPFAVIQVRLKSFYEYPHAGEKEGSEKDKSKNVLSYPL